MTLDLAATSASVAIAISTAGLGTPVALVAAHVTGSAATSIAVNAADQGIDIIAKRKEDFDTKQLLSKMLENGIIGGISTTVNLQSNGVIPDASVPYVYIKNRKYVANEENKRSICLCRPDVGRQSSTTSKKREKGIVIASIGKNNKVLVISEKKLVAEKKIESAIGKNSKRSNKNDKLKNEAHFLE